jgi:pimeloyl-ACP methyl ester carboxylesterase
VSHKLPQVPGVEHEFVRVGERRFHVAKAGGGEGAPIVLVHGWPEHWYAWRLVMPLLAERHRVLAVDLRGFGWSDIAWDGFEKERMADDLVGVLGALGIERVRLVGHDWGGWIGFLLALRRPDLVERFVAINVPPPWARRTLASPRNLRRQLTLARRGTIRRLQRSKWAARYIRRAAADRENLSRNVLRVYVRDLRASTRARAGGLLHRTFLIRELAPILGGRYRRAPLETPTLLLLGDRDPLVPPKPARYHRPADPLRVEVLADAGHYLPEEAPELVATRISDFLAEARGPALNRPVG